MMRALKTAALNSQHNKRGEKNERILQLARYHVFMVVSLAVAVDCFRDRPGHWLPFQLLENFVRIRRHDTLLD